MPLDIVPQPGVGGPGVVRQGYPGGGGSGMNADGSNSTVSAMAAIIAASAADPDAGNNLNILTTNSLISRTLNSRFIDIINAKDYALADGTVQSTGITTFFANLAAGYTHGTSPFIAATARKGYFPGGNYDGNGLVITSPAFGWTLRGDGIISQLDNVSIRIANNFCYVSDVRFTGSGALEFAGTGLDVQGAHGTYWNIQTYRKNIGIDNDETLNATNNTFFAGYIRECNKPIRIANRDFRGIGMRVTNGGSVEEGGIYFYDAGGVHMTACNIGPTLGPSLVIHGNQRSFTGNTTLGSPTITGINIDTALLAMGVTVTGSGIPANSVIIAKPTSSSITLDNNAVAPAPQTGVSFLQSHIPDESFWNLNTLNNGGNLRTCNIVSIVSAAAGASILVTTSVPHELSMGMNATPLGTGNVAYDGVAEWIQAIPTPSSVQLAIPFAGNVGAVGTLRMSGPDVVIKAENFNSTVRSQYFIGGNQNYTRMEGGANINVIGGRWKSQIWMLDGDQQPNNFFFTRMPDGQYGGGSASDTVRNRDICPGGPGSLLGWGAQGFCRIEDAAGYSANKGSYYVGAQAPYTDGGLENNQPAELNFYGAMNTGFRLRSNGHQYDIQGTNWILSEPTITLTEGIINRTGTIVTHAGRDTQFDLKAYRSNGGTPYGNAIHTWVAPRSATPINETADGGAFIVLPGNNTDAQVHMLLGATPNAFGTTLGGTYTEIQALPSVIDIRGIPQISGFELGTEYFRLAGVGAASESFMRINQNARSAFTFQNNSSGTAATAVLGVRNAATNLAELRMEAYGTGFTTAAHAVADGAALVADTALAGGLSIAALGGLLRIYAGTGLQFLNLPTTAGGATPRVWVDAAVLKYS